MATTAAYLDFLETTTSADVSEQDALGLLNFALLFQEKAFVNDTPLGDSTLLIESFRDGTALFTQVTEFLRAKILGAHFRSQVSIEQETLYQGDEILTLQLYDGWKKREKLLGHDLNTAAFTCRIHGRHRNQYHHELDKILRGLPIARYNPDEVKSRFREEARTLLQDSEWLDTLTQSLPINMQRPIKDALERPFFTLRDIYWPLRERSEAQDLLRALAFINQHSYATKALAAPLGAHQDGLAWGELDLAIATGTSNMTAALAPPEDAPQSVKEFFESAPIQLTLPSIRLLAKLSPDQVFRLRETAEETLFATARDPLLLSPKKFVDAYGQGLQKYVSIIDENLARWYRHDALTPTTRSNAALGWGATGFYAARECWNGRWDAAAVSVRNAVAQTPVGQRTVAQTLLDRKENMPRVVGSAVGAFVGGLVGGSAASAVAGGVTGRVVGALAEQKIAHLLDYFMVLICDRSEAARGILEISDTWDRHVHTAGLSLEESEPTGQIDHP